LLQFTVYPLPGTIKYAKYKASGAPFCSIAPAVSNESQAKGRYKENIGTKKPATEEGDRDEDLD
jgi:hypothetical protein